MLSTAPNGGAKTSDTGMENKKYLTWFSLNLENKIA